MEQLNKDEKCVLENVLSIVRECISPSISFSVIDSKDEKRVLIPTNGPITISKQLLDLQFVHQGIIHLLSILKFHRIFSTLYVWLVSKYRETSLFLFLQRNPHHKYFFPDFSHTNSTDGIISESALKKGANMSRAYEKLLSEVLLPFHLFSLFQETYPKTYRKILPTHFFLFSPLISLRIPRTTIFTITSNKKISIPGTQI